MIDIIILAQIAECTGGQGLFLKPADFVLFPNISAFVGNVPFSVKDFIVSL